MSTVVIGTDLVYSLLTILTAGIYLIVILVLQQLFIANSCYFHRSAFRHSCSVLSSQRKIQDLVDQAFFHQKYDYRRLVLAFGEQAQRAALPRRLARSLPGGFAASGPDKAGLYVIDRPAVPSAGLPAERDPSRRLRRIRVQRRQLRPGPFWARPNSVRARRRFLRPRRGLGGDGLGPPRRSRADVWLAGPWAGNGRVNDSAARTCPLLRTMAGELMPNLDRIRLRSRLRAGFERNVGRAQPIEDQFISTVSHELRTPMSSVQGGKTTPVGENQNSEREKFRL